VNKIVADNRLGEVKYYIGIPPDINMRIPEEIRKCTVFLGISGVADGVQKPVWKATGFLMGLRAKKLAEGGFMFLVTAKHNVIKARESGTDLLLRANTKSGASKIFQFVKDVEWYYPEDTTVDLAAVPVPLDPSVYDINSIGEHLILTEPDRIEAGIGVGDEVYITGLFRYHAGSDRNIPIVRTGSIAMVPESRILVKNFGEMDAFLIESRSIGGLSGSPVFAVDHKKRRVMLLGIVQGHYDVRNETIIDISTTSDGIEAGINTGIAVVTPAAKLVGLFDSAALKKRAEEMEDIHIAAGAPKLDTP
jgi:hypothetical protein